MIEPYSVHRLRHIMQCGHGPFTTSDLEYILRAYRDMIETLEEIERTSRSLNDATLATDCLNRVRS